MNQQPLAVDVDGTAREALIFARVGYGVRVWGPGEDQGLFKVGDAAWRKTDTPVMV